MYNQLVLNVFVELLLSTAVWSVCRCVCWCKVEETEECVVLGVLKKLEA